MTIRRGDVYCPRCGSERVGLDFTFEDAFWSCEDCKHEWTWEHDGTDWEWPPGDKPNPGCPWCGTANIRPSSQVYGPAGSAVDGKGSYWACLREACGRRWRGHWTRYVLADGTHHDRWTIRVPASQVPAVDRQNPAIRRTLDNPTTYPHQETS